MNPAHAENLYRNAGIETASKAKLVQLLLARAIGHAREAHGHCLAGRIEERFRANTDAAAIVAALRAHLDLAQGGEIARSLDALYAHVSRTILNADLRNDAKAIDHVIAILSDMEQAWKALANAPPARLATPPVAEQARDDKPRLSLRL